MGNTGQPEPDGFLPALGFVPAEDLLVDRDVLVKRKVGGVGHFRFNRCFSSFMAY